MNGAAAAQWPQPFALRRLADPTGVSDIGRVATGVVWPCGRVSLRWDTGAPPAGYHAPVCQVAHYESAAEVVAVHGHGGSTVMKLGSSLYPDQTWGLRLFAVVAAGPYAEEVWWWGAQWYCDGPAVTLRLPSRFRFRPTPQLTYWPAGAHDAVQDLNDGTAGGLRIAWLPADAARISAAVVPPAMAATQNHPPRVDRLGVNG